MDKSTLFKQTYFLSLKERKNKQTNIIDHKSSCVCVFRFIILIYNDLPVLISTLDPFPSYFLLFLWGGGVWEWQIWTSAAQQGKNTTQSHLQFHFFKGLLLLSAPFEIFLLPGHSIKRCYSQTNLEYAFSKNPQHLRKPVFPFC